jgi:hypothetical protein
VTHPPHCHFTYTSADGHRSPWHWPSRQDVVDLLTTLAPGKTVVAEHANPCTCADQEGDTE